MTKGRYVPANTDKAPRGWQDDPMYAREMHSRIRGLAARGLSQSEIAHATGVSSRGVNRILNRPEVETPRCGAPRMLNHREGRKPLDRGICTTRVRVAGERCPYHR